MTHNEILIAIAAGKQLQASHEGNLWRDITADDVLERVVAQMRLSSHGHSFRIKPEPNPDVVLWGYVGRNRASNFTGRMDVHDNVTATYDGETSALKSVRMIGEPCPEKMKTVLRKMTNHTFTSEWRNEIREALKP